MALVGRPNVGKSSLLNRLAKEERSVVDPVAGTTVDPVDSLVTVGGEIWQFVDTAGLRKRAGQASGTEYYASLRTSAAIEASEVTVVLFDSSEVISEQDQRLLSMVSEAGRGVVLAFNKWDLVDDDRRHYLDKEIDRELKRIPWALRVNISALTGRAVDKLAPALRTALRSWEKRIATGRLNQWLTALTQATPHPVRGGARRASCSPPSPGLPAQVRAVHDRPAGRRLCALHRAQAARGIRLRGQSDRNRGKATQTARSRGQGQGARLMS